MQHNSDYYREQAGKYRELAAMAPDDAAMKEYLELAAACEEAPTGWMICVPVDSPPG
jgi:hypothetical protein